METLYKKTLCNKKPPNIKGYYYTNLGKILFTKYKVWTNFENKVYPVWWLEPLPPQKQVTVEDLNATLFQAGVGNHLIGYNKQVKYINKITQAIHKLYGEKESQFGDSLTLIEDINGGYTIYLPELPNLITEAEEIKDVPKRLTEAFEVMLEYMIENKRYKIILPPKTEKL